jgi:hypothetical protein
VVLGPKEEPFFPLLETVAAQLKVPLESWSEYGLRAETRREHALELQALFGFKAFTMRHYRKGVRSLEDVAWQTDKGIVLASALVDQYRRRQVLLPTLNNIERICAEAITRANRRIYAALTGSLTDVHRLRLDALLRLRDNGNTTLLGWLRQSPARPNSRHMLEHIERLRTLQALDLPNGIERQIHQNRLLKIAREGGQMTPADLAKFEPQRRGEILVATSSSSHTAPAGSPLPPPPSRCGTPFTSNEPPTVYTTTVTPSTRRCENTSRHSDGTHQSHRRLPMAQHRKTWQEQVQAASAALTYDLVRFLKRPLFATG